VTYTTNAQQSMTRKNIEFVIETTRTNSYSWWYSRVWCWARHTTGQLQDDLPSQSLDCRKKLNLTLYSAVASDSYIFHVQCHQV